MPFDSDDYLHRYQPTPIQQLISALRAPLPENFEWDYRSYGTTTTDSEGNRHSHGCAVRLGIHLGILHDLTYGDYELVLSISSDIDAFHWKLASQLGIAPSQTLHAFNGAGVPKWEVTPEMVAAILEGYSASSKP